MRLGIRTKLTGTLLIAAVLPLAIGMASLDVLGYRYYKRGEGELQEALALRTAARLELGVAEDVANLREWLDFADIAAQMAAQAGPAPASEAVLRQEIAAVEATWPAAGAEGPRAYLANSIAGAIRRFQSIHPIFSEVLVTDAHGRLIAASGPVPTFFFGDEAWWKKGARLGASQAFLDAVRFDDASGSHVFDVVVPLRQPGRPEPLGVVKGVMDAAPLFSALDGEGAGGEGGVVTSLILGDGRVVVRAGGGGGPAKPLQERVDPTVVEALTEAAGWATVANPAGKKDLVGFAALKLSRANRGALQVASASDLFVVVSRDLALALQPVRRQLAVLTGTGTLILLVFTLAGILIAEREIIAPVKLLRSAAQSISASAGLEDEEAASSAALVPAGAGDPGAEGSERARSMISRVEGIHSRDELEQLAHDFTLMGRKVLSYHGQLQREIAAKTEELQRDLEMAREFQEALLPGRYPRVPAQGFNDPLSLRFCHVYQPAQAVGGDFFNVARLDDHTAGIFIADVMGHGARSALVTAILGTMLKNYAAEASDPARVLKLINRDFSEVVGNCRSYLFVTAFYLVLDTRTCQATFASAGHPSPLHLNRERPVVQDLMGSAEPGPALAIDPGATYASISRELEAEDVFLLYTDGAVEAPAPGGDEFGRARLAHVFQEHAVEGAETVNRAVVEALAQHVGDSGFPDDVCLVGVEALAWGKAAPKSSSGTPWLERV